MRDGWEAEAEKWATFAGTPGRDTWHEDVNLPALRALLPGPGRRTLDLGCGEGRLGRYLRSAGYQVAGADAAPTMVRLAAGHPDAAPAVVADAAALPFRDEAFGLVVAYMCLHDIDRMPAAVAEAARVLEAYSRALEDAGLLIEAIREVRAPDAMVAAAPGRRRWQRIPLSLHLRAVKRSELKP